MPAARIIEPSGLGRGFGGAMPRGYTTVFPVAENPISEGGVWNKRTGAIGPDGGAQSTVVTGANGAHGTSSAFGASTIDDSYALLSGFPPDQYASAIIHASGLTGNFVEVELLLRGDDSGTNIQLYECFMSGYGQYLTIARWGSGTFWTLGGIVTFTAPADGDLYEAQIIGNIIKVWLRGTLMFTCDVSNPPDFRDHTNTSVAFDNVIYSAGNPGIGFDTDGDDAAFGFSRYTARGL
jgi:hypothetical protein